MYVLLDIESRSRAKLKKVGGRKYWQHTSSEIISLAYCRTSNVGVAGAYGDIRNWRPGDPVPWGDDDTLVAHNMMGFDRFGLMKYGLCSGRRSQLRDSSYWACRMGLNAALDVSAEALTNVRKDRESSKFVRSFSQYRRPPKAAGDAYISPASWKLLSETEQQEAGIWKELTESDQARSDKYCRSDVRVMQLALPYWRPWIDTDHGVAELTDKINDRGMAFDRELAEALLECDRINTDRTIAVVARKMGWSPENVRKVANSPVVLAKQLGLPNAREAILEKCTHPLARARRALRGTAKGKLQAGLVRLCNDGRLRDYLNYYGASPGRWTSTGVQMHNTIRPDKEFKDWKPVDVDRLADDVIGGRHIANKKEIDLLLRASFVAGRGKRLVVRDFSAIEARALAWSVGDKRALEIYRRNGDTYIPTAAKVFGVRECDVTADQRYFGKKLELACQYGLGGDTFLEKLEEEGIDYRALGVDPHKSVMIWRQDLHPEAVLFWHQLEDAFRLAAEHGRVSCVGPFKVRRISNGRFYSVVIELPSGRVMVYPRARVVQEKDPKTKHVRSVLGYDGRTDRSRRFDIHGRPFTPVYGGLLTQNCMEGMCRDLLAEAMLTAEADKIPVVLTVHDEIVAEVYRDEAKDAADCLQQIMSEPPDWARGMPISAAGFEGRRYGKW